MMEEMSDGMDHGLTRQICPQGLSQGCMIDTNDLFGVMDRRI